MSSSFLAEIEAEHHNDLLERGNLQKARLVHAPFTPKPVTYHARCIDYLCKCGHRYKHLEGFFKKENTSSGSFILTRIPQPQGVPWALESTLTPLSVCTECVLSQSPQT